MPAKSRSRRGKISSEEAESPLGKGWPPAWSVSFSDITTLLMVCFVLWFSLTTAKIPTEFLVLSKAKGMSNEELEQLKGLKKTDLSDTAAKLVTLIKKVAPNKEKEMFNYLESTKTFRNQVKEYLNSSGLGNMVEIRIEQDTIILTPRSAMLFAEGEAKLKTDSFGLLDKVAEILKKQGSYELIIEGHTDTRPINPYRRKYRSNLELSYARALAVAQYFISKDIPSGFIGVMGYGPDKPKYPNDSKENMAKNRRVEIYIRFFTPEEQES